MKDLIYVTANLKKYINTDLYEKLKFYFTIDQQFWSGTGFFSSARYGKDYCPFDIKLAKKTPAPVLDFSFDKTFAQISDERALELLSLCRQTNKKLAVYWSGGIDSTVALSAIIKNWPRADLKNVEVFLNKVSIIENYYFFKDQVIDNNITYTYMNRHRFEVGSKDVLKDYVSTDGQPADKLWFVMRGFPYFKNYGPGSLTAPWKQNQKNLIEFITSFIGDEYAVRYYDLIADALEDFPHVQTVGQWFGWINYNYHFQGHIYNSKWIYYNDKKPEDWDDFQRYYQPWYHTADYQKWAWADKNQSKFDFTNFIDYKKEAKQYIFELTKEHFYYTYKSKNGSDMSNDDYIPMTDHLLFDDGSYVRYDDPNLDSIVRSYLK